MLLCRPNTPIKNTVFLILIQNGNETEGAHYAFTTFGTTALTAWINLLAAFLASVFVTGLVIFDALLATALVDLAGLVAFVGFSVLGFSCLGLVVFGLSVFAFAVVGLVSLIDLVLVFVAFFAGAAFKDPRDFAFPVFDFASVLKVFVVAFADVVDLAFVVFGSVFGFAVRAAFLGLLTLALALAVVVALGFAGAFAFAFFATAVFVDLLFVDAFVLPSDFTSCSFTARTTCATFAAELRLVAGFAGFVTFAAVSTLGPEFNLIGPDGPFF